MASNSDEDDADSATENRYEELPHGNERYVIAHYFHKGFTNKQIMLMLKKHHDVTMHERTLKRRLRSYGRKRRQGNGNKLLEHAREVIAREIELGPDQLHRYRTMWQILRVRYHIRVPRSFVASVLKETDPSGVEERKRRCFQRRRYHTRGSNFTWHLDGYVRQAEAVRLLYPWGDRWF
mgnify:CR=1 FL=1